MKIVLVVLICFTAFQFASADVWVNGYTKKDGTVVAPHYRSNPDGIKENNYSEQRRSTGNQRSYQSDYNNSNSSRNKSYDYNSNPYLDEVYGR